MKKYNLSDGGHILATSHQEFAEKMRQSSKFDSECTNEEYMASFAERYEIQTGNIIQFDSPDNFVDDLVRFNYITSIE